jgi:hypothetical protein
MGSGKRQRLLERDEDKIAIGDVLTVRTLLQDMYVVSPSVN